MISCSFTISGPSAVWRWRASTSWLANRGRSRAPAAPLSPSCRRLAPMSGELTPVSIAIALTISAAVALARPRVSLYITMACVPSQFLFVPVQDFFISPADVLIGGIAVGLAVRLLRRDAAAWSAIFQHRFVFLM